MTSGVRRACGTAAALAATLLAGGCIEDSAAPPEPAPPGATSASPRIRLGDVSVAGPGLDVRAGLYLCGDSIVASPPAGGMEGDSFVVFDTDTRRGDITELELPRGMRPNARWLLTSECVESGGEPAVTVAYQEMPLLPEGGRGVRATFTLDGERLWRRSDLNKPAEVVDDVLVLGAAPDQPETAVDLRTGKTLATFDPSVETRTVVSGERVVVSRLSGPPVLTTLTGRRIASLQDASWFSADGGLLFGVTPAALPDLGEGDDGGLTDASPSPSPTQTQPPEAGSELFQGEVQAYSLRTGKPLWSLDIAPDPLGEPQVEGKTGVVVVVDVQGVAHGIDPDTGRELWQTPTELDNPRVTTGSGILLFDKVDDTFQKVVDADTGLPLPEPQAPIVDLDEDGALQVVDGVPARVPARQLRLSLSPSEEPPG